MTGNQNGFGPKLPAAYPTALWKGAIVAELKQIATTAVSPPRPGKRENSDRRGVARGKTWTYVKSSHGIPRLDLVSDLRFC
jgi:hypothetical protein